MYKPDVEKFLDNFDEEFTSEQAIYDDKGERREGDKGEMDRFFKGFWFITIIIFIIMSIEKKYLLGVGAVVSLAVLAKLYLSNPKRHSQIE